MDDTSVQHLPPLPTFGVVLDAFAPLTAIGAEVDLTAASLATAHPAMWNAPNNTQFSQAAAIVAAIRSSCRTRAMDGLDRLDPRPLTPAEELTMLSGLLEVLSNQSYRTWHHWREIPKPVQLAVFPTLVEAVRQRNPHLAAHEDDLANATEAVVRGRRVGLLWAVIAFLYVRDRVQHGKGNVIALDAKQSLAGLAHSRAMRGLVVLPPMGPLAYRELAQVVPDKQLSDFLKRSTKQFKAIGEMIDEAVLLREIVAVVGNPFALTRALLTVRLAVTALIARGFDGGGSAWEKMATTMGVPDEFAGLHE